MLAAKQKKKLKINERITKSEKNHEKNVRNISMRSL